MNPAQPPEGILDPQQPYWPANKVGQGTWLRLKSKLTGRQIEELQGERHTSYVKLSDADADRVIENVKKWGKYPQVNQNDKYGGAYNAEAYQKWLVEEFLEKPFREKTDKKIEEAQQESRIKEISDKAKEDKESVPLARPQTVAKVTTKREESLQKIGSAMKGGIKSSNISTQPKSSETIQPVIQKIEPLLSKKVDAQEDDTKELQQAVSSVKINEDTSSEEKKEDDKTSKSLDTGFKFLSGELKTTNDKLDTLIGINESSLKVTKGLEKTLNAIKSILLAQVAQDKEEAENAEEASRENALEQTKDSSGTQQYQKTYDDTPSLGKMFGGVMGAIDFADDVFDFSRKLGGKRRRGLRGNRAYKKFRRSRPGRFFGSRFNLPRGIRSRRKLSAGGFLNTAYPAMSGGGVFPGTPSPQPVMIGEAGPEVVTAPKLAGGGLKPGLYDNPTRGNLLPGQAVIPMNRNVGKSAAGVDGIKKGEGMGFSQPLATVMTLPFKAFGAGIFGIASSFLSVLGPLAGLIRPVIAALAKPLAKILGIPGNLLTGILGGSASAATLDTGNVFDDLKKQYGDKGQGKNKKEEKKDNGGGDDDDTTGNDDVGAVELKGTALEKSVQLAKKVQSMFGLTDFQAAAIVGTWRREGFGSGYPDVREGGKRGAPTYDGPSTMGYGFAQWTNTQGGGPNDRLNRALIHLGMGPPPKKTRPWTVGDNLSVFKKEIDAFGYGSVIPKLKATKNIRDAVRTFVGVYEAGGMKNIARYEKQEGGGFIDRRLAEAKGVLKGLAAESGTSTSRESNKSYMIKGPNSGYPIKITTDDGSTTDVTAHGKESVHVGDSGFTILPHENNKWSVSKNPFETFGQWNTVLGDMSNESGYKQSKQKVEAESGGWFNWFRQPKKKRRVRSPLRSFRDGQNAGLRQRNFGEDYKRQELILAAQAEGRSGLADIRGNQIPRSIPKRNGVSMVSAKPKKSLPTTAEDKSLTPMQQWAKNFPDLAKKVKPGQSGYDEIQSYYQKQALSAASKKGFELAAKGIDLSKVTSGAKVPPATAATTATAQASVTVALNAAAAQPKPLAIPTPPPVVPPAVPRKETIQSIRQRELLCRL